LEKLDTRIAPCGDGWHRERGRADKARLFRLAHRRLGLERQAGPDAMEIWRDDMNAKGGLIGRPVELVCYDDQSNPGLSPGIYTKLIDIDHVDLLFAFGTNLSAPAMPTAIEHKMLFMTASPSR
jgi:hypothetical protein